MELKDLKAYNSGTVIVSPITKRETCIEEDAPDGSKSYIDLETGYYSNSNFTQDSEVVKRLIVQSPEIVRINLFIDEERDIVWFLSVIQIPNNCIIHPDRTSEKPGYQWVKLPLIEIEEYDRKALTENDPDMVKKYNELIESKTKKYPANEFFIAMSDAGALLLGDETDG